MTPTVVKTMTLLLAFPLLLQACSGGSVDEALPTAQLTETQFEELKANCGLTGATFGPTARTETTIEDGVESTVTYEAEPGDMSIFVDEPQVAGSMHCISSEFKRLGASAKLGIR